MMESVGELKAQVEQQKEQLALQSALLHQLLARAPAPALPTLDLTPTLPGLPVQRKPWAVTDHSASGLSLRLADIEPQFPTVALPAVSDAPGPPSAAALRSELSAGYA